MAEYIKREAAVKAANEWVSEACKEPVMRLSRLFDKLQNVPAADAQGIKERIAMDIERYGDCKVVSVVSDRGREEQMKMEGAKL